MKKSRLIGKEPDAAKDRRQEKGTVENEVLRRYHNEHEFEHTLGYCEGQKPGMLQFMGSWSRTRLND